MNEAARPVRILGIGNVLMGDDGLGPTVVEILQSRYELPSHVEIVDGGTPGLDFLPYISNARSVIVVDTVSSAGRPGAIKIYRDREIIGSAPPPRLSPHQPGLRESLMATELTDANPDELVLIGVVPETVEQGTRLSAAVEAAIDEVLATVIAELDRLGITAEQRQNPLEPNLWWV